MNLIEYIQQFPRQERMKTRKRMAAALGISEVFIRNWCNGHKKIPAKHARKIEIFTKGLVSRHTIAPDFYLIEEEK